MKARYGRHFVAIEMTVTVLLAAAIAAWATWGGGWPVISGLLKDNRSPLYSTCASVAGSLLGFVIAALAIVLSSAGSARMAPIKGANQLLLLFRVLTAATVVLGTTTVLALLALLLDRETDQRPVFFYLCLGGGMLSAVALARAIWILHGVVAILAAPSRKRAGDQ